MFVPARLCRGSARIASQQFELIKRACASGVDGRRVTAARQKIERRGRADLEGFGHGLFGARLSARGAANHGERYGRVGRPSPSNPRSRAPSVRRLHGIALCAARGAALAVSRSFSKTRCRPPSAWPSDPSPGPCEQRPAHGSLVVDERLTTRTPLDDTGSGESTFSRGATDRLHANQATVYPRRTFKHPCHLRRWRRARNILFAARYWSVAASRRIPY